MPVYTLREKPLNRDTESSQKVQRLSRNFLNNSDMLSRIEGQGYLENTAMHTEYLKINPFVARKKFINLYSTGEHA